MEPDYTAILTLIASHLEGIKNQLIVLNDKAETHNGIHAGIAADINTIKQRADNENVGIVTRGANYNYSGRDRALLVLGLQQSDNVENFSKEMTNPTYIPGLEVDYDGENGEND